MKVDVMTNADGTAIWHVIKYMPDLRRREPRNVGIVLATPDGWMTKFIGEGDDGEIKGNRLGAYFEPDVYRTWVDYFRRKALTASWGDVERQQANHPINFVSEVGGEVLDPDGSSWQMVLDRMFADLVQDRPPADDRGKSRTPGSRSWLVEQARAAMKMAEVPFEQQVQVPARYGDYQTTVPFEFRHGANRKPMTLMDAIPLVGRDPAGRARELRTRIVAARDAAPTDKFVAFYVNEGNPRRINDVLAPLEREAIAVDVSNLGNAADTISEVIKAA